MTDREKAIVMAYTGVVMLAGDKLSTFHKYIEDICGRPIWTHELASLKVWEEIKEKSKNDFLKICATSDETRPTGEWLFKKITDDYRVYGQCSICKQRKRIDHFCSNCGADMRKQSEGDDNGKA